MDKDFYPYLYAHSTVPDVIESYATHLLGSPNPITKLKAKKLLDYWQLLNDRAFFDKRIQNVFYSLYQNIDKVFKELTYELSGRIKGLTSTLNKIEEVEEVLQGRIIQEFIDKMKFEHRFQKELTPESVLKAVNSKGKSQVKREFVTFLGDYPFDDLNPFDRIRDFFAFRVIIEDKGEGDLIDELYQVTNLMIDYFHSNSFEVVKSHPLINVGEPIKSEIIYIPEKTGIKEEYKPLVKDYVLHPKRNGYQSLHFVVHDLITGRYFEVQVRTRSMDIVSQTLTNHDRYKTQKYGKFEQDFENTIDYTKIKVKGFRYFKYIDPVTHEERFYISDKAGVTEAIPIKLEFEHFLRI